MKSLVFALSFAFSLSLFAVNSNRGETVSIIYETNGTASCTNYVGFAKATPNTAPSTNNAVWKIIATILDASGNEVTVKHAYGTGELGNAQWSTAWTNRVNATYR